MKRRSLFSTLAAVTLVMVTGLTARAQAIKYTLTDLGALAPNSRTAAAGINDSGQVTGSSQLMVGYPHAFIWIPNGLDLTTGAMKDLGLLSSGNIAIGKAINALGMVAGYSGSVKSFSTTFPAAARWNVDASGKVLSIDTIKPLGGGQCQAYGINDAGQVVGWSSVTKSSGGMHAFLWTNGSMVDLGGPPSGSDWRKALGINSNGVVVGLDGLMGWYRRTPSDTAPTELLFNSNAVNVYANNHDIIAGAANGQAILYDLTDGVFVPLTSNATWGGTYSEALALNSIGQMVGQSGVGPFVYNPSNGMQALSGMFPQPAGRTWVLDTANGINNRGQICGYGYTTDTGSATKVYRAFLLTPNP